MLLSVREILTPLQWDRLVDLRKRLDAMRERDMLPGDRPPPSADRRPPGAPLPGRFPRGGSN